MLDKKKKNNQKAVDNTDEENPKSWPIILFKNMKDKFLKALGKNNILL